MEEDNIVLAKDIEDCDSCPLKDHGCPGGWTSGGSGQPIEPPCCSWNDDTEVYAGMYDREYIYSEQELKWIEEERKKKNKETKEVSERIKSHMYEYQKTYEIKRSCKEHVNDVFKCAYVEVEFLIEFMKYAIKL